ncbi:hypothetical protein CSUI_009708, partial [Cystoisospora suis]
VAPRGCSRGSHDNENNTISNLNAEVPPQIVSSPERCPGILIRADKTNLTHVVLESGLCTR